MVICLCVTTPDIPKLKGEQNVSHHAAKQKLVVKVHDHLLIVAPSTTQCQLYVCGDTS